VWTERNFGSDSFIIYLYLVWFGLIPNFFNLALYFLCWFAVLPSLAHFSLSFRLFSFLSFAFLFGISTIINIKNFIYYTSNLSKKLISNSLSFLIGLANLPTANKSLVSSYSPIVVMYGVKLEPVTKSWYEPVPTYSLFVR